MVFAILLKSNHNLGGLVVRIGDCKRGTPGSNTTRDYEILFSFNIEETCTLTTFD